MSGRDIQILAVEKKEIKQEEDQKAAALTGEQIMLSSG